MAASFTCATAEVPLSRCLGPSAPLTGVSPAERLARSRASKLGPTVRDSDGSCSSSSFGGACCSPACCKGCTMFLRPRECTKRHRKQRGKLGAPDGRGARARQ